MLYINKRGKSSVCSGGLALCFAENGDAVLDYRGANDLNFARGPMVVLATSWIWLLIGYQILKGKWHSPQQLFYNETTTNSLVKLGKQLSSKFLTPNDRGATRSRSPVVHISVHKSDVDFGNPVFENDVGNPIFMRIIK
jgi:hypothetical protein